jgi:hypothetical protein
MYFSVDQCDVPAARYELPGADSSPAACAVLRSELLYSVIRLPVCFPFAIEPSIGPDDVTRA